MVRNLKVSLKEKQKEKSWVNWF